MTRTTRALTLIIALGLTAACSGGGASDAGSPTGAGASGSHADAGEDKGVMRVAGTGISYPHSFTEGTELVGFDTEVIEEAAERAGYSVEFTTMDFPGLLGAVNAGRIDTTATNMTWTPERGEVYVWTTPYAYDGVGFAAQQDREDLETLEDVVGRGVATGAGSTNELAVQDWMEATGNEVDLRSYDSSDAALQEVMVGRADLTAGPRGATIARIEKQGLELKTVGDLISFEQTRFPFADTEQGRRMAEDVSASLEEMHEDGTLSALSEKYFTYDRTEPSDEGDFSTPDREALTYPGGEG